MKNNKLARISLLVLTVALCFVAVFAMTAVAEEPAETPLKILSQNVEYNDKFSLMYAVDASATAPVKLYLYEEEPAEGVEAKYTYQKSETTAGAVSGLGIDAYIITTDGVAAAAMTKQFYVKVVDGAGKESAVKRYSVAEYLYERLAGSEADDTQRAFYESTIAFGSSAQKIIAKEADATKYVDNYRYVTVEGGTIGGYSAGVYPIGAELTLDDASAAWKHVAYDKSTNYDFTVNDVTAGTFTVVDGINKVTTDVVNYRSEIDTLNSYKVGDKVPADMIKQNNGNPTWEFVNEGDHGTALKVSLIAPGNRVLIPMNDTAVAADDAKAFEFSFDIKMEYLGTASSQPLELRLYAGTSCMFRTNVYAQDGGKTDHLYFNCPNGTSGSKTVNSPATEWNHIRVVIYEGDANCYVYVNNDPVPYVNSKPVTTFTGDVSTITQGSFNVFNDGNIELVMDNFYCGYTMEENPNTTPAQ